MPKIVLHSESNTGFRGKGRPKTSYRSCINLKVDLKQFNLWDTHQQSFTRKGTRQEMAKLNRDLCLINPSEKSIDFEYNKVIKKDKSVYTSLAQI